MGCNIFWLSFVRLAVYWSSLVCFCAKTLLVDNSYWSLTIPVLFLIRFKIIFVTIWLMCYAASLLRQNSYFTRVNFAYYTNHCLRILVQYSVELFCHPSSVHTYVAFLSPSQLKIIHSNPIHTNVSPLVESFILLIWTLIASFLICLPTSAVTFATWASINLSVCFQNAVSIHKKMTSKLWTITLSNALLNL